MSAIAAAGASEPLQNRLLSNSKEFLPRGPLAVLASFLNTRESALLSRVNKQTYFEMKNPPRPEKGEMKPEMLAGYEIRMTAPDHIVTNAELEEWQKIRQDSHLSDDFSYLPAIKNLSLSSDWGKSDDYTAAVLAHCSNLQSLTLNFSSQTTFDDFSSETTFNDARLAATLALCPELQSLDLCWVDGNIKFTEAGIAAALAHCPKLKSLKLFIFNFLTYAFVAAALAQCPLLESLEFLPITLTNAGIAVWAQCHHLHNLTLRNCSCLTDTDLAAALAQCHKLKKLNLFVSSNLTNAGLAAALAQCLELQSLGISGDNWTNAGIAAALAQCPLLKSLSFEPRNNDGFAAVLNQCHNLESLSLSRWLPGSGIALATALDQCSHLQSLTFENSDQLTDDELPAALAHCPHLQSLTFRICDLLTNAGIAAALAQYSHPLSLTIDYCSKITKDGLTAALARYPNLPRMIIHDRIIPRGTCEMHILTITPSRIS